MSKWCVPLKEPKPDSDEFINVLMGKETASKSLLIELLVDGEIMRTILEKFIGQKWVFPYKAEHIIMKRATNDKQAVAAYWDNYIEFWYRMGYDCVMVSRGYEFTLKPLRII